MKFTDCLRTLPVLALVLAGSTSIYASELATATMLSTQLNATTWEYDLTLNDTGTTNVGTFWFSWVPGEDFMPTVPTDITSAAGWTEIVTGSGDATDGSAIQWIAGPGAALTAGESVAGFSFESTTSPATMAGLAPSHPTEPILTSFVYSGAPFSDPGLDFQVQQVAAAPEPGSIALGLIGGSALFAALRRRKVS
jgi:hypothetical protein